MRDEPVGLDGGVQGDGLLDGQRNRSPRVSCLAGVVGAAHGGAYPAELRFCEVGANAGAGTLA